MLIDYRIVFYSIPAKFFLAIHESMAYTDKCVLLLECANEAGTEALVQASTDANSGLS